MSDAGNISNDSSSLSDYDGSDLELLNAPDGDGDVDTSNSASRSVSQNNTTANTTCIRKKRRRGTRASQIWKHARKHLPGVEAERCEQGRKLWWCSRCPSYNVTSTSGARAHMWTIHQIDVPKEAVSKVKKARHEDISSCLACSSAMHKALVL